MPVHRNTSRNKKERLSCPCNSETAEGCNCPTSQRNRKRPRSLAELEIYNIPRSSTSSTSGKPPVSRARIAPPHAQPPPKGPSEGTMSSFQVEINEVDRTETTHETASSVEVFTPTKPSQEQAAVGRAGRRRRSPYSPPPHPPPPSPFSSSSSSPPAYGDNRRPILMPSPHRPTAFPSVSEYPSHYPSTPHGSPGRPLPLSSIAPNSPVPPVTYPSSLSPHNHYSSSYYGSISSDTTLSSPFNYSQRSFGSDSMGSQNPSPAALPALSFSDDSPAPSAFLPLYDLNPNNFVEQPSAVGPLGEFLLDFPTQNSVPQEVFYHGDDFLSTYGPYGQSSSLRHAVDPPDAVLLGNTSTHHNWSSALFRHPHQGYP